MSTIICDISAWEYWRTPPDVMDARPLGTAATHHPYDAPDPNGPKPPVPRLRANARGADALLHSRLLTDLKGLSLPIRIFTDDVASYRRGIISQPRRIPANLPPRCIASLGGGLSILTPEATLLLLPGRPGASHLTNAVRLAKVMFEAAGIFTLTPSEPRLQTTIDALFKSGAFNPDQFTSDGVYGYSDARGIPLGNHDRWGNKIQWRPVLNRRGQLTDMWKRPPITCVENIAELLDEISRNADSRTYSVQRRALSMAMNGSASPAETKACLLLCAGVHNGGESWGNPFLNRHIPYTHDAKILANRECAIGDLLWPDRKTLLEVQGEEFHADDLGFRLASGRTAALESMGFSVAEITPAQMADLELFDALLPSLGKKLGFVPHVPTAAYLKRRSELHRELFCMPYGPQ